MPDTSLSFFIFCPIAHFSVCVKLRRVGRGVLCFLSVQKQIFLMSHTNLISQSNSQSESRKPLKWPLMTAPNISVVLSWKTPLLSEHYAWMWTLNSHSYRSKQVLFEKLGGKTGWDLRNRGRSVWGEKHTRPLRMEKYWLLRVFS